MDGRVTVIVSLIMTMCSMEIETDLKLAMKERLVLKERIDELWTHATVLSASTTATTATTATTTAAAATSSSTATSRKQGPAERAADHNRMHVPASDWREDVREVLLRVLQLNEEHDRNAADGGEPASAPTVAAEQGQAGCSEEEEEEEGADGSAILRQYRRTVVETLAKIVVRHAVNEGVKRELLRRHLIAQEKRLRFLYGGDEYRLREMERQQRQQDDVRQRLRSGRPGCALIVDAGADWLLVALLRDAAVAVAAKPLAVAVVQAAVTVGLMLAVEALFDPWAPLDWPLQRWMAEEGVQMVERRRRAAQQRHLSRQKRIVFYSILSFLRLKKVGGDSCFLLTHYICAYHTLTLSCLSVAVEEGCGSAGAGERAAGDAHAGLPREASHAVPAQAAEELQDVCLPPEVRPMHAAADGSAGEGRPAAQALPHDALRAAVHRLLEEVGGPPQNPRRLSLQPQGGRAVACHVMSCDSTRRSSDFFLLCVSLRSAA